MSSIGGAPLVVGILFIYRRVRCACLRHIIFERFDGGESFAPFRFFFGRQPALTDFYCMVGTTEPRTSVKQKVSK